MGIEFELGVLLALSILGQSIFAAFAIETPAWQKIAKWSAIVAITLSLYGLVGHWALSIPFAAVTVGMTIHFVWCGRHGIDPVRATPKRRYYELRGWQWTD
jgi:hypothetical protein